MAHTFWSFIGVQRDTITTADEKLNEFTINMFESLEHLLGLNKDEYSSIQELIDGQRGLDNEYSYFWDWFNEKGLTDLKIILSMNIPDHEAFFNLIDYREMLLELDVENGLVEGYFSTFADTVSILKEHLISAEYAASTTMEDKVKLERYFMGYVKVPEKEKNSHLAYSYKNPAEVQQDFCYYLV